jgi:DNA-binding protein
MTETTELKPTQDADNEHSVFIGGKPFMNYVTAVVMQFTTQNANKVVIKSRGKFISKAVDISEVVRNRFLNGQIVVENITANSEEFENKEGRTVRVSTLEISLIKSN